MDQNKSYSSLFFSKSPENFHSLQKFVLEPIAEDFVLRQLKQLKTNKAIGLDNVSARLLKDSASVVSGSLTRLFNQSLESRTFPSLWKFEKSQRCSRKVIAAMQTIIGP